MKQVWVLLCCLVSGRPSIVTDPSNRSNLPVADQKVVLRQGTYLGFKSGKGKTFLGIPYAKPPVGVDRFLHSKPIDVSTNSSLRFYNANQWGSSCYGRKSNAPDFTHMSEDCLNLNVFVPEDNEEKRPVIVWIFGSAFNQGNDQGAIIQEPIDYSIYDGQRVLNVDDRAIIVTVNYRVNAFGFLSGNSVKDLNPGLSDQVLAFKWIKDNIEAFGGDKNQITAMGCSAGAITIGALMLADNGGQQLFDRAILLSGPAPFAIPTRDIHQGSFETIAKNVGCNAKDEKVVECLQAIEPAALIAASQNVTFFLTADGDYLKKIQSFSASNFSKIPLLINTVEDETKTFFSDLLSLLGPVDAHVTDDSLFSLERFFSSSTLNDTEIQLANVMYSSYSGSNSSSQTIFAEFFADWQFNCPASKMAANYASAGVETYVSRFTHVPLYFKYLGGVEKAFHGSDIPFFWQLKPVLFPTEWELADRITRAYIDFAVGNRPVTSWKPFNPSQPTVFNIDTLKSSMDHDYPSNQCTFFYSALALKSI